MTEAEEKDADELAHEEHRALGWAAVVALAAIVWIIRPVGVGILLGAFLAFMVQPPFTWLCQRVGAGWAAMLSVAGSMLALVACVGGLGWLLVARGTALANQLIASFQPGGAGDQALSALGKFTERFGATEKDLVAKAREFVQGAADRGTDYAKDVASTLGGIALGLLFAVLAMHYILRNWDTVSRRAEETFPLRPDYTKALFAEFRRVGRTTLVGAVGTAIAQGVTAAIGFWIAGAPEPAFFGAATAIASFVPAVGVLLVIVPVSAAMFLTDHVVGGIVAAVWGLVVTVGVCDYIIRPQLTRGESKVPALVTFAALFGGVEVLGLKGLIVGPVLMALALSVLRLYATETSKRRQHPGQGIDVPAPHVDQGE
ncbi:MAG TPA: AI-2E family transporter [Kofleriaceae bacterium]